MKQVASLASVLMVFLWAELALAEFPKPRLQQTTTPYAAVQLTAYTYDQPRPLRAWAVRIDLIHPDIEFVVTPATQVEAGWATRSMTTLDFAKSEQVQLAINASPFMPLRQKANEPMNIDGMHLSRGKMLSPPKDKPGQGALVITGDNQAKILPYPIAPSELASARHGVGGFYPVLKEGQFVLPGKALEQQPMHPRTAVGLSDKGRYLYWLIVDGRQPGLTEGLTYQELGDWALSLGITDLLNLDGGGSSTLVVQEPTSRAHNVINTPVGKGPPGTLRFNGNNLGLRIYAAPDDVTLMQLQTIMPKLKAGQAKLFLGPLNRAMHEHQINTPLRRAAFLAQLAHESGELRYLEEIASGEAYERRADLGNTEPGDGKRYKGRGPIQLTGRANYRKAGAALQLDLEAHPELATDPETGCRIAGWYWTTRQLNTLADAGNFKEITRKINGGYRGLAQREAYYLQAKTVLGVK